MATFRVAKISASGAGATQPKFRVAKISAGGSTQVVVAPFSSVPEMEPGTTRSRTATLASSATGTVTWAWTQVSGPTVDLVASGAGVTFEAPSIMPGDDPSVVLGVTATVNGVTSAQVLASHTIRPQTDWVYDGTEWVGSTRKPTAPAAPETPLPNLPDGYALFKEIDLTSTAGWEVREGQTTASGVMRAANVSATPTGLRLAAGRIGGEVSSAEVRLNGSSSLAAPNFCFMRTEIHYDTVVGGIWPAVWRRPFPGSHDGELDDFEKFGTTAHATLHTTDYTQAGGEYAAPGHRQRAGANFSGTAGGSHVIESLLTPTGYTVWWDGVLANTITPADFNANATPTGGSSSWSPQLDTLAKKWQIIFSNQVNSSYGGGLPAGAYAWNLYIDRCRLWVPA